MVYKGGHLFTFWTKRMVRMVSMVSMWSSRPKYFQKSCFNDPWPKNLRIRDDFWVDYFTHLDQRLSYSCTSFWVDYFTHLGQEMEVQRSMIKEEEAWWLMIPAPDLPMGRNLAWWAGPRYLPRDQGCPKAPNNGLLGRLLPLLVQNQAIIDLKQLLLGQKGLILPSLGRLLVISEGPWFAIILTFGSVKESTQNAFISAKISTF